jgi:hypothetical protein
MDVGCGHEAGGCMAKIVEADRPEAGALEQRLERSSGEVAPSKRSSRGKEVTRSYVSCLAGACKERHRDAHRTAPRPWTAPLTGG